MCEMKTDRKVIGELIVGYRKAKILFTAASMNLFALTRSAVSACAISKALRTDLRSTGIFMDSLAAMGFLKKKNGFYRNMPLARRFLVPGKKEYLGHNLQYQDIIWDAWSELGQVIKSGVPPVALGKLLSGRSKFLGEYIKGMGEIARKPAEEIASVLELSGAADMLDVGGGPGSYSIAFLERNPNPEAKATILDLKTTLKVTRQVITAHRLHGRITLKPGNYHTSAFGKGRYDLVLFSHVTHDEGPEDNLRLFKKAFSALRKGGQVVIHDFMLNSNKTAPLFSALFSVHMLVYTKNGRVYSTGEYSAWLKKAGFRGIKERQICSQTENPSRILVAGKP